jgi:hypothetical protein
MNGKSDSTCQFIKITVSQGGLDRPACYDHRVVPSFLTVDWPENPEGLFVYFAKGVATLPISSKPANRGALLLSSLRDYNDGLSSRELHG